MGKNKIIGELFYLKIIYSMRLNANKKKEDEENPNYRRETDKHSLNPNILSKSSHRRIGTTTLLEIKKYQLSTNPIISKSSFLRIVKEIGRRINGEPIRFSSESILALQEASEDFLVRLFEDSNLCARHARRITVLPKDFCLVK